MYLYLSIENGLANKTKLFTFCNLIDILKIALPSIT